MPLNAANVGLFLHILASFWLVAGVFGGTVVRAQVKRSTDLKDRVAVMRVGHRLAQVFTMPGAVISGLLGFWLLSARGWGFQPGWVHASITLYVLMLIFGFGIVGPRMRATLRAAEASLAAGAPTPEYQKLTSSKLAAILADVNALGIVLLTLLMTLKPF